jgi:hypothetical protein
MYLSKNEPSLGETPNGTQSQRGFCPFISEAAAGGFTRLTQ